MHRQGHRCSNRNRGAGVVQRRFRFMLQGLAPEWGLVCDVRRCWRAVPCLNHHANGIAEARALWTGSSSPRFPASPLICDAVDWNSPWSWHMDPGNLRLVEIAIEVCQGTPSYVEANCKTFGGGQYCPAGAQMVELRDCDASPECPAVPR